MKIIRSKAAFLVALGIISLVGPIIFSVNVMADALDGNILSKAHAAEIAECYKRNVFKEEIKTSDYRNKSSVFSGNTANTSFLRLPNVIDNQPASTNCADFMANLYREAGVQVPGNGSDEKAVGKFLESIGYTKTSSNSGNGKCYHIDYNVTSSVGNTTSSSRVSTAKVCATNIDNNGYVKDSKLTIVSNNGADTTAVTFKASNGKLVIDCAPNNLLSDGGCGSIDIGSGTKTWDQLKEEIRSKVIGRDNFSVDGELTGDGTISKNTYRIANSNEDIAKREDSYGDAVATYKLQGSKNNGYKEAADKTTVSLLGSIPNKKFTEEEKASLYYAYLRDFYKVESVCNSKDSPMNDEQRQQLIADGYVKVKLWYGSSMNSDCYVRRTAHKGNNAGDQVNGLNDQNEWYQQRRFDELIEILNDTSVKAGANLFDWSGESSTMSGDEGLLPPSGGGSVNGPSSGGGQGLFSDSPLDMDQCMSLGGAMGWIFCPALSAVTGFLTGVYEGFIVPMLEIKSSFVSEDSGTRAGWEIFRQMANLIFVIMLLFIIFSQVTGVGIDNYGIKRTLPKLVITAILVNFSFFICQLAVDLSNILGAGLQEFFAGLGASDSLIGAAGADGTVSVAIGDLSWEVAPGARAFSNVVAIIVGTMGISAAVAGVFALMASPALILSILVSFLGVAVSVLFMFVSLGVRMVGVILLVAISPLAFVAYALPNTNGLFKKWLDVFKAMLLLYPICGLLIGGGQFASLVMLASMPTNVEPAVGFFYVIIALFVMVLPFFALPALLKKTMAAASMSGISSIGQRLSGRVGNIKNSEGFKRTQTRMNANFMGEKRGKILNALNSSRIGRHIPGVRGATRAMRRNLLAQDKLEADERHGAAMMQDRFNPMTTAQLSSSLSGTSNEYDLSVGLERLSGMDMKAATDWVANEVSGLDIVNSDKDRQKFNSIREAVRNNDKLHQALSKEEDVKRMLDKRGYLDGKLANLGGAGGHSADFANSANHSDILGLSSAGQRRAFATGGVSPATIDTLLDSEDPAIRSAIAGDQGKQDNFDALRAYRQGSTPLSTFTNSGGQKASDKVAAAAQSYRSFRNDMNAAYAENDARNNQQLQRQAAQQARIERNEFARSVGREAGQAVVEAMGDNTLNINNRGAGQSSNRPGNSNNTPRDPMTGGIINNS